MKRIAAIALLVASPQAAAAPPAPCVSRAEIADMAVYFLPPVLAAVTAKCRPSLPAGAFLVTEGPALIDRLSAGRDERWPRARDAFNKIAGSGFPQGIDDQVIRQTVDELFRTKLASEINTADCGTVDDFTRLLSPLPADNLGELSGLLVALSMKGEKRKDRGFPVCAPAAP